MKAIKANPCPHRSYDDKDVWCLKGLADNTGTLSRPTIQPASGTMITRRRNPMPKIMIETGMTEMPKGCYYCDINYLT